MWLFKESAEKHKPAKETKKENLGNRMESRRK